ncbi:MAG: type II toxin-antitoxin system RelE family toxin [Nitrososphaera sp.]|uniref:type II toxin-antitoxin system RelE family toxin n=1 Tax=Nitrososphaera sp. TaxID=1971748 RepID=UPI003D6FE8EA
MTYRIKWTELAAKQFEALDKQLQKRIQDSLSLMLNDPFSYVKRLRGVNLYSFRAGDYRAIVSIEHQLMVIVVVKKGHRSTVYRGY